MQQHIKMSKPEAIEANVTIENPEEEEGDDVMEMKNMPTTSKTWNESEKSEKVNRRQSLLERMRSSKSKSNESTSEEEPEEPDEEDDIKPLPEDAKRKRKKAAEVMKRPSFQKQTSRLVHTGCGIHNQSAHKSYIITNY